MKWYQGDVPQRMRTMAADLGFYDMMQKWGVDRAHTDACFANTATLDKIKQQQAEVAKLGLDATPSFVLNSEKLDVHDWPSVYKLITDKLAQQRAGNV